MANFGIFICLDDISIPLDRSAVVKEVEGVVDLLGLNQGNFNLSYMMNARRDLWLY